MGKVEGVNQLADHGLRVLLRSLQGVHHLVDLGCLEARLREGPRLRRLLHGAAQHVLQVGVHGALVHAHDLAEHLVLALAQALLGLTPAALLRLAQLPVALGQLDHGGDATLLLEAEQLLRELVEGLREDAALNGLQHTLERLVAELVDHPLLLHRGRGLLVALGGAQLVDEVQALLLALEHLVLVRAAADDALEKKHCRLLLLLLGQHLSAPGLRGVRRVELAAGLDLLLRSTRRACEALLQRLLALGGGLLQVLLDGVHGLLEGRGELELLTDLVARLLLLADLPRVLVDRLQHRGRQGLLELHQAGEGHEVRRLHLDLRSVRVGDVAQARKRSVDLRRVVGVVGDHVLLLHRPGKFLALPLLLHLAKNLRALTLAVRQEAVALLLLPDAGAVHLVAQLQLAPLVAGLEGLCEQYQALLLQFADAPLAVSPIAELLGLHESHADV
mmetsp:Transcript_74654/g.218710  ORF Transcript_74654/g.218710 Transcript_74654/m.218710 type:complete len:447 (+) Transcript_74654:534-1874(+)